MDKYIFLDIDGVIATPEYTMNGLWTFNPEKLILLEKIVKVTDANIVISSSWRKENIDRMKDKFAEHGMSEFLLSKVVGSTIRAYQYISRECKIHLCIPRGVEIKQWIDANILDKGRKELVLGTDYIYIILDDDTDMLLEQSDYFLNTNWDIGLTEEISDKAISILNGTI